MVGSNALVARIQIIFEQFTIVESLRSSYSPMTLSEYFLPAWQTRHSPLSKGINKYLCTSEVVFSNSSRNMMHRRPECAAIKLFVIVPSFAPVYGGRWPNRSESC